MNQKKVDLTKDFQPCPIDPKVDQNADEIDFKCDKLITELSGIKHRIASIQKLTDYCGPATDAEGFINKAIQRLQTQKRCCR